MASAGWSFLKVLENPSKDSKNLDENDSVYVHPMVKRSASALSTKSLEMCTESLGSETGSEGSESGDEFCAISVEERERLREIQISKCRNIGRKIRRSEFPPPLTSISGSDGGMKVKHHREGGRLVIQAVSFYNCGTSFAAERTNGRLKLSMSRDCSVNYESERVKMEGYEEEESEEEEEEGGGGDGGCRRDMDGNQWIMAGKREVKMVTRCNEGGNGNKVFANLSWVAIS
ncbi:hypothetical protein L1987_60434 [Smallanthus sonchifolius]|uniref:Uncharacterized protein n=1 Tax=Smallanthus sonchifolius TaxID=185202 RepID=A0ACB9D875_9ASTR|nr:hypothetical protein L1987_60434 [Smallanthus sonchifolius]